MLPCGQPFMSGEPWKAAFPWPCCIIGVCVWAMRGESRGLCGVPGPPKPPSACWLIPVVDASRQVNPDCTCRDSTTNQHTQYEEKVSIIFTIMPRKDEHFLAENEQLSKHDDDLRLSVLVCIQDYCQALSFMHVSSEQARK